MAGAFDLILRGLDIGGESPWMAALREGEQEAPARGPGAERRRAWMKDRPATGLTGYARDDLGDGEHDLWLTATAAANR